MMQHARMQKAVISHVTYDSPEQGLTLSRDKRSA